VLGDADALQKVTSATVTPWAIAASRSTWSEPIEVRGLRDAFGGEVGGPERLRDHDLGVGEMVVELGVRSLLAGVGSVCPPG
jgi:hypothetical protein